MSIRAFSIFSGSKVPLYRLKRETPHQIRPNIQGRIFPRFAFADVHIYSNHMKCIFYQVLQVENPVFENLFKASGLHEPAAKRAKVASPLQVIPTQSPRQSFAADDIQQCLFKTTNVRPVNMQQLLAKRQENTCFCK